MSHLSETEIRLALESATELADSILSERSVYYIRYPYYCSEDDLPDPQGAIRELNAFIERTDADAAICVLSSPVFVAKFLSRLTKKAFFKLWVGVKLKEPLASTKDRLPQHHAALAVVTRYRGALEHAKTRIAYTFCPFCEKTTKDYGGKKHLYHEYGTVLSDVWRDVAVDYADDGPIVDRLRDLFGVPAYERLMRVDLSARHPVAERTVRPAYFPPRIEPFAWEGGDASTIVNGDCLEVLRQLPSNSVDFCFADPPYNVDKKYDSCDDHIDIVAYFDWCDRWLAELARVVKPGKTVAVLNIPQWAVRHFRCLEGLLRFQNWIVWESLSVPVRMIMPAHYSILCFTKGPAAELPYYAAAHTEADRESLQASKEFYCIRPSCVKRREKAHVEDRMPATDLWWDIHRLKHNSRRVDHPTQLPPLLMKRLIAAFTAPGDLVLDPFNGSGTTSLCAAMLGRRYFGIELSPRYHAISVERHRELQQGIDPFGKHEGTPQAKNSVVKRLEKRKYEVDKKTLQLEVKRIARLIGRVPDREDVIACSCYPIEYFDDYFISWSEVTAAVRTSGMQEVENRKDYESLVRKKYGR